jgi:protein-arginine kinase activator protein McsA
MKCSRCNRKAEFFLPDEKGKPKVYFCENCAIAYLKQNKEVSFLPRIKILK